MKTNLPDLDEGEKTPQGQCPLCYVENPYSVSHCVECSFPLPWARTEMHEREPCGACVKCQVQNPYSGLNCWSCGAFLPWAYAITTVADGRAATQLSVLPPDSQAHYAPPLQAAHYSGDNTLMAIDGRNQFVDAISFLCPPLGFVAYISLLVRLPQQAISAAKFALYGLLLWFPVLLIVFVRSP